MTLRGNGCETNTKRRLRQIALALCVLAAGWAHGIPVAAQNKSKGNNPLPDTIASRMVKVEKVYIIGNKRTRESIITRELNIEEDAVYEIHELHKILEQDKQKLLNTRLFHTVELQLLETAEGLGHVLVKVEERWYFFPAPILKLADRNFNDWWTNRNRDFSRVNYGLRLDQFNLRGLNDRLILVAQFGFTRDFEFAYRLPYIDRQQRHGITAGALYTEYKNLPYLTIDHLPSFLLSERLLQSRFVGYFTYTYRNAFYNFHHFSVSYKGTQVSDTVLRLNPYYFASEDSQQRFVELKYQFVHDKRDFVTYPLKGRYFTFQVKKSGLSRAADLNQWDAMARYYKFWSFGKGFYLASNVLGLVSGPGRQPYFNNHSLGFGFNYLRGYELDVIEGPAYFLFQNSFKKELFNVTSNISRFMLIPQFQKVPLAMYFKVFFDAGYVQNYPNYELNKRLSNRLLYGTGVGIDFVSFYDMVVRTEYSYNSQGTFHFFLNFKAGF